MINCFSHVWLFVTLQNVACQAPLPHGILQARILEWVPMPSSTGSSWLRGWTCVSCITGRFFTTEQPGKPQINSGDQISEQATTQTDELYTTPNEQNQEKEKKITGIQISTQHKKLCNNEYSEDKKNSLGKPCSHNQKYSRKGQMTTLTRVL